VKALVLGGDGEALCGGKQKHRMTTSRKGAGRGAASKDGPKRPAMRLDE
jgi:hypothetical protein